MAKRTGYENKERQKEFVRMFQPETQKYLRMSITALDRANGSQIAITENGRGKNVRTGEKLFGFGTGSNQTNELFASLIKYIHEETKKGKQVFR